MSDSFPLAPVQEPIWVVEELAGDSALQNVPLAWWLDGSVDVAALERALGRLAARHDALRMTFEPRGSEVVQTPAPPVSRVPVRLVEPVAGADAEILETAVAEARRPFSLGSQPPLRAALLRQRATRHLLVLTLHHIVTDGWSLRIVEDELAKLYASEVTGERAALAPLATSYGMTAARRRAWLDGAHEAAEIAYWRGVLDDVPPILALPTDRSAGEGFGGAHVASTIDAGLCRSIEHLARSCATTPSVVLLAAFEVLLARLSGQSRFVVGMPVAGRLDSDEEDLVGLFMYTVALPVDVSLGHSFAEVVTRTRESVLAALARPPLPADRLLAAVRPPREAGRNPLYQVLFDVLPARESSRRWGPLRVTPVDLSLGTARFDLTLYVEPDSEGLGIDLEYRTALFERASAERLVARLRLMLAAAAAEPAARVGSLPLLDEEEQSSVVQVGSGAPLGTLDLVPDRIAERARSSPDLAAVSDAERSFTFAELETRSTRVAAALRDAGVGPEDAVGVCAQRSALIVVAILGIWKAGAAYVPLDAQMPGARLASIATDAGVRVALADRACRGLVGGLGVGTVVELESVATDGRGGTQPRVPLPSSAVAYVMYTSGSTGRPKGVMVEHRQLAAFCAAISSAIEPAPARWSAVTNVGFDISMLELTWTLATGRHVEIAAEPAAVADSQAAALQCTPSLARMLLATGDGRKVLGRLEVLLVGGEALTQELAAALTELVPGRVVNVYGPTETTVWSTSAPVTAGCAR